MQITKIFKVESAHIVRNCTSHRCSHSIHGHSAKIEVTFEAETLDNAQMVMDFGLMGNEIKKFIDSMDHCYLLCTFDKPEFKQFIKENCDRWIELPFNPSAEMLSLFIFWGINNILSVMEFSNGEGEVRVKSVKYHETETGSALAFNEDGKIWDELVDTNENFDIIFSPGIIREWNNRNLEQIFTGPMLKPGKLILNPTITQQIKLK